MGSLRALVPAARSMARSLRAAESGALAVGHRGRGRAGRPLPDRRAPGGGPARGSARGRAREGGSTSLEPRLGLSLTEPRPPALCQRGGTNRASPDSPLADVQACVLGQGSRGRRGPRALTPSPHAPTTLRPALPVKSIHSASFLRAAGCLGALGTKVCLLSGVCPPVYPWVGQSARGKSNPSPTKGGGLKETGQDAEKLGRGPGEVLQPGAGKGLTGSQLLHIGVPDKHSTLLKLLYC